jgi:hypothetical protein
MAIINAARALATAALAALCGCSLLYPFDQPLPDASTPICERDEDCNRDAPLCTSYVCRDFACRLAPGGDTRDLDGDEHSSIACGGDDCDDTDDDVHPGAPERCNGVDDDCSGTPDDGPGMDCSPGDDGETCATPCGTTGVVACSNECVLTCFPPTETCNGADDDCDDAVDELFECPAGGPVPCATACGSEGVRRCDASCRLVGPCVPPDEVCNDVDDDCDDLVDEGIDRRLTFVDRYYSLLPVMAWNGEEFGLAWLDSRWSVDGTGWDVVEIHFARLTGDGRVVEGSERRLTVTDRIVANAQIAWTGTEYLIVYALSSTDRAVAGNPAYDLYSLRIDATGTVLTPPRRLTAATGLLNAYFSAIAWNGSTLGVAWEQTSDVLTALTEVYFVTLDALGEPLGEPVPLDVFSGTSVAAEPALLWNGAAWIVAWSEDTDPTFWGVAHAIMVQRLALDGTPLGAPLQVTDTGATSRAPTLAHNGTDYFLAWRERDVEGVSQINFTTFDDGTASPQPAHPIGPGFGTIPVNPIQSFPRATWNGERWSLAWNTTSLATYSASVFFGLVEADGETVAVTRQVTPSVGIAAFPRLSWEGTSPFLVWFDSRDDDCRARGEPDSCISYTEIYASTDLCLETP